MKEKIISEFEKMLKRNRLNKKKGAVMLTTAYNTYFLHKRGKTKKDFLTKFMVLYLLCEKFTNREDFKKIAGVMQDKKDYAEKGLNILEE